MKYNEFDENTKRFLKTAMIIYSSIKDSDIVRIIKDFGREKAYRFTKLDKKAISIFIAGFLAEGNLKKILNEYDDIRLVDLFSFINVSRERLSNISDYRGFYNEHFELDLDTILNDSLSKSQKKINFVTPEVIFSCLRYVHLIGIEALETFKNQYNIQMSLISMSEHPLFKAIENYTLSNGSVTNIRNSKESYRDYMKRRTSYMDSLGNFSKIELDKKAPSVDKAEIIDLNDEHLWDMLDEIKQKFVGQEDVAEGLFYNIVNNQQIAELEGSLDGQRSIIFLDGPTGTGKTAITREITQKLNIPFISSSVTNYSSTGYVGGNITDNLKILYEKAGEDLEKAQRGIIVFDEFDKLAYSQQGGLEMKRAVQHQLLDFLGGGKYTVPIGDSIFDNSTIEFDTSKLTFVCLGALTNLINEKTSIKNPLGFGQSFQPRKSEYNIMPQDLIDMGLERELVGRFNTYLHTDDYSQEELIRILKESTISPLLGFKKLLESRGKSLEIDDNACAAIAKYAYALNTGARSLQTVMNTIRTYFLKDILRGNDDVMRLDAQTIEMVLANVVNRKRRS